MSAVKLHSSASHHDFIREECVTLAVFRCEEENDNLVNDYPMSLSTGQCFSSGSVRPDASHSTVATAHEYCLPKMVTRELRHEQNHAPDVVGAATNDPPLTTGPRSFHGNVETSSVGSRRPFEVKLPVVFGDANV